MFGGNIAASAFMVIASLFDHPAIHRQYFIRVPFTTFSLSIFQDLLLLARLFVLRAILGDLNTYALSSSLYEGLYRLDGCLRLAILSSRPVAIILERSSALVNTEPDLTSSSTHTTEAHVQYLPTDTQPYNHHHVKQNESFGLTSRGPPDDLGYGL